MSESHDRQRLARIALRQRAALTPSGDPNVTEPVGVPDELDAQFERSFGETFGGEAPAGHSSSSLDIDVEVDPAAPAEAAGSDRDQVLRQLAAEAGIPAIDLDRVTIDLAHLELVPRDLAVRNLILPVLVHDGRVVVAVADPSQRRIIDELEFVTGLRVVPHVALHTQLRRFIDACFRARASGETTYAIPGAAPVGRIEAGVIDPAPLPAVPVPAPGGDLLADVPGPSPLDLAAASIAPSPAPLEAAARPRRRILVVDDENDIRTLIVRVLRDKGYDVDEAAHGADALRKVQANVPDLLILDAMLPEVHGFDVCRRIKRSPRYAHLPVIMISAIYRGWRFAHDLKASYGVDHFMEKPFKIGALLEKVTDLLSGDEAAGARAERELSVAAQQELAAGARKFKQGDIEGAVAHLRRGLEIDPLSQKLHYHLGVLCAKQGRVYEAIHEMEAALEIEPGDFAALRSLAQLYEHAGFRYKAVEMWERAAGAADDEAIRASIKERLLKLL